MADEQKRPSRYQSKVWSDTVLEPILRGDLFYDGIVFGVHIVVANAHQIGQYFPGFGGAFDTWVKNNNFFNKQVLQQEAEKVLLALPVPYEHPDVCYELDEKEKEVSILEAENARLKDLLSRSVRVEDVDFDGERGCRFILGEDHVVTEWRGDGVSIDRVFLEKTALSYGVTTTPHIRCMRMVLEMAHWEVLCAMVAGPGDGNLKEAEFIDYGRQEVVAYLRSIAEVLKDAEEINEMAGVIERGEHAE